jgi:farnesyl-diphosphate farnesyltransferase
MQGEASAPPPRPSPIPRMMPSPRDRQDERWRERLAGDPLSPAEAAAFAAFALERVSRTFALNIRVLPEPLREQVLHAYLYCRMADTLEDDATLPVPEKAALLRVFAALFHPDFPGEISGPLAAALPPMLPPEWRQSRDWEKILLARTPLVLAAFSRFPDPARRTIADCVQAMCAGMADFALRQDRITRRPFEKDGAALIETVADLDRYCWFVAGTVGVMLCDLFIAHGNIPESRAGRMRARQVSFGSGLQLVNILKDIADDRARGVSWLPGDLLAAEGITAADFARPGFEEATRRVRAALLAKALRHLEEALEYTTAIPRRNRRLRLFCLWPLLMAAETLALIGEGGQRGQQGAAADAGKAREDARFKITRARVARIVRLTGILWWSDGWLRAEFGKSAAKVALALHQTPPAHTFHAS